MKETKFLKYLYVFAIAYMFYIVCKILFPINFIAIIIIISLFLAFLSRLKRY